MVVPEEELEGLMLAQPGQTFSQAVLTQSEELMACGSARTATRSPRFAPCPSSTRRRRKRPITFFVDPRNRVYVRRINFNGADNVNDEVFRREMRQLEGGYLSNALVDRSKLSLQQLPYVESVEHETTPVPGSPDLVDVDFEIEEGLPGQFGGSLGFSETYGVTLGGNFIHSNFMGTGRRVALELRGGEYQKVYDINFTDPYRNIDGVARTMSLTYQDITQFTSATSDFSTTTLSAGMNWSYPDRELPADDVRLRVSGCRASDEHLQLAAGARVGAEQRRAVQVAGAACWLYRHQGQELRSRRRLAVRHAQRRAVSDARHAHVDGSQRVGARQRRRVLRREHRFYEVLAAARAVGCSGSTTSSRTATRSATRRRCRRSATATAAGRAPCAVSRKATSARATRFGNPYGGNLLFANQFELIIPTPEKIAGSTRIALFYDVGGVFSTGGVNFFDKLGDPIDYDFDYDKLKKSVGLGVEWLAPLGLLRFSYAMPLNEDAATDRFYGDEVERFQFSIGNAF